MQVAITVELGPDGRSQARRCASRPFGPPDKMGFCARKDHTGCCYRYPYRNSACARSTRPLSGLGISTVNPRSRDLAISLFHSSTTLTLPSTFINLFHFQTPTHKNSHSNLRISRFSHPTSQKCLPKLLRRSPPPVARPQLARHLPTRRRLARRLPPLLQARRRSVARQGRRPTLATSTKVCFSLARRAELQTLETWSHFILNPLQHY
jgi:hypothetical protein